ncbi:MAG: YhbY family RNA-binding protein [Azoarcus sp.]|jgi:putative YhbY family RNA-binding protein|nr:YhbY family RNA-binding protein [Azoarcus sp.]
MPKIELTPAVRQELRARAHALNPVVTIADNGLTPNVLAELERSLQAHELIKVRVQGAEREVRDALLSDICTKLEAAPVQRIGNILILWRPRKDAPEKKKEAPPPKNPATAQSAAAFAAAARRAALAKTVAGQKHVDSRRGNFSRPQTRQRIAPRGGR